MLTRRAALQSLAAFAAPDTRFVGVTVMPEYIQHEGVNGVLDNLQKRARVTAVATSPYVIEPATEKTGSREPPIDAGAGKVRLLDRPLWGKRELFVRTAPSFAPETRLYARAALPARRAGRSHAPAGPAGAASSSAPRAPAG